MLIDLVKVALIASLVATEHLVLQNRSGCLALHVGLLKLISLDGVDSLPHLLQELEDVPVVLLLDVAFNLLPLLGVDLTVLGRLHHTPLGVLKILVRILQR